MKKYLAEAKQKVQYDEQILDAICFPSPANKEGLMFAINTHPGTIAIKTHPGTTVLVRHFGGMKKH